MNFRMREQSMRKNKFILWICLALGLASGLARAQKPTFWFPVGEKIFYKINWGVLAVGEAVVWTEWIEENARDLLAIRLTIRTTSVMSKIYPVNDFVESIVDPKTFLPLRFMRNASEGRYRLHEVTTFDHANKTATWKHLLKARTQDFKIDADTRDILSFMYFARSKPYEAGTNYIYKVMADEKVYDLDVQTLNMERFYLSNYGWVRGLKLEPVSKFNGLFIRTGRAFMWISNDSRRICTKASVSVPVARVSAYLKRVEGPGDDFWVKPGDFKNYDKATLEDGAIDEDKD